MSTYSEKDRDVESWAQRMQALMGELEQREPFSYDPNSDMLYRQYRDQYQTLGRQAMEDTVGQAAALTGGYGSTYGESAGAAAYESWLNRLNDRIPELYALRQDAYEKQTDALNDRLSFAAQQKSLAEQAQAQSEQAADKAEKDAFERCMELLENGIRPSDSDLSAAGLTSAMADTALAVFRYETGFYGSGGSSGGSTGSSGSGSRSGSSSGSGSSGGSGNSGSSGSASANGTLTADQIRQLQNWLGVTADGQYGPQTQAAAEAQFGASGMSAIQAWIAYQKAIGAHGGSAGGNVDIPN